MRRLPSRLRRLDGALADLPVEEPMLLTELDGFLTGILVCPDAILPGEWMQTIWGSDDSDVAPFDDPLDVQWFLDAVMARYNAIARDLGRGRPQPIFDIDERNGDVLWELWVDGFAEAMELRPDGWTAWALGADPDAADAAAAMALLIAIARNDSPLDSMQINDVEHRAPSDIGAIVQRLHAARLRRDGVPSPATASVPQSKTGRNDPCPCGSGKKFKRCCGGT